MSTTTGSDAVALIESVYRAATVRVPDLPQNVSFTINWRGGNVLGYYRPSAWKAASAEATPIHEIAITGSSIRRGTRDIVTTVLHEATHALAKARGVKDTSRQGRYHNLRFVALAEELGLVYPHRYPNDETTTVKRRGKLRPDETIGYSSVVVPDHRWIEWAGVTDLLDREFPFDKGYGEPRAEKPRDVLHQYVAFPEDERLSEPRWDLVQMAPSKYERITQYLSPHFTTMSTATQRVTANYLQAHGVRLVDDDSSTVDLDFDDVLDVEGRYPELTEFARTLSSC